jgi:hypothetical protein
MQILDRIIQWFYRYVRKVQDKKNGKKVLEAVFGGFCNKINLKIKKGDFISRQFLRKNGGGDGD